MRSSKEFFFRNWVRRLRQPVRGPRPGWPRSLRPTLETLEERSLLDAGMTGFTVTNLVSDLKGVAAHTDVNLVNPWGFAETPGGQFQVAANGSGDTIRLNARGDTLGQDVILQPPLGSPPGTTTSPNGTFLNTTSDFVISDDGKSAPAEFIFSTEDGTIVAFNPMVDPKEGILAAQASDGAVYKLLAEASNSMGNFLFATDFHNNKIDVFDKNFDKVTLGQNGWGTFTDPNGIPAGFAPFGIKLININGQDRLFVSYAKQKGPENHDDQEGPGNGLIDEFDTTGHFIQRFATGSAIAGGDAPLNSPIGMTIAPAGFGPNGKFGGALLVGNFGDSHVTAFDLKTGKVLGQLSDAQGNPLTLNGGVGSSGSKGLWGIAFGNGQGGTDPNALYFAAGINNEADGLFGKVTMSDADNGHHHGDDSDLMSSPAAGSSQQGSIPTANNSSMSPATASSPSDPLVQALDAFFQKFNAEVQTLESSLLAMHPQLSGLISMVNADLSAFEAMIESKL
jgi:uncharacterized protein (TIGR03118 family)